ncbi:PREDICTED: uncharacterized protein LOC104594601 [Nelumbo nucifera]|uniref:Uncharacterized protein LOC104594601 n=1 Tax=Nelumbo nucifera TaxID=4432 RepID=A0A1U8Q473_NELNU|nr:PREDICTED: uncharacterized protein LOC104594601 [Nelumbo nucifera]XP_019052817.1 PREDICTED: uncharacterized protein LOC104594601 [Nelumbo nucifera]XP_019052818.1 PREDICTED: uncharacterized protein LOC104594601 [Nelumbo nucifera]XP_019052819.1 PREDICTED: uncharacterized protein LOC104594601 [Nelumbo nucifera]XP_019052820.1 PREDICTED: uncharacterized protein LOC104594601 [Nelumbo nucifera]XP_019052821.1 PREDICTED: uncharacterized protein LOC104594601 [Nelumbo nucifera]XP_019052822.1 PREDICTE
MDVAESGNSVSKYVDNLLELEQSCLNLNQCPYGSMESNLVEELENAPGVLHDDDQELVPDSGPLLGGDDEIYHADDKTWGELKIHQLQSSISTTQKGLTRFATFPCSGMTCAASMNGREEIPAQSSTLSGNPTCTRSISLPTPLKLVSAMKGSREKQGMPLKKLNVTWAPDVYDPPATSLSHTVKSHNQHRSRGNKKNGKHKHKSKSSRGSGSDKKQSRKVVSSTDTRSKLPTSSERLLIGGLRQSTVETVDFATTGQDTKCGSSFLRTSLAKMHISVAEAT